MGTEDQNNENAKSKIEQIRIDLEKKLAAIEDSKKNAIESDNLEEEVSINETENPQIEESEIDNNSIAKVEEIESNPVFEISEPIIPIESNKNDNVEENQKDKKNFNENQVKGSTKESEVISDKQDVEKIVSPPKTVIAAIEKPDLIDQKEIGSQDKVIQNQDEKSKKGILSFLIYGLLIAFFIVIGYLFIDYTRENKSVEEEKMNQKLSEFKNKRYLDSIELADLNSQLEDLQSKKMLDSLDNIYEQELISNSKFKNKKEIQRNFDLTSLKEKNVKTRKPILSNSNTSTQQNNVEVENNSSNSLDNTKNEESNVIASNNDAIKKDERSSDLLKKEKVDVVANNNDKIKDDTSKTNNEKAQVVDKIKHTIKSPIYPGCEKKKTELDRKKCFTSKMYRHISRKFNANLAQNIGLEEGIHQVRVQYIIDKAGYATVLNVRAENKKLEQEAIRVIQSLPKMTPGTKDGKRESLQYNIPIKFAVNN